jgi:hypothetical protein
MCSLNETRTAMGLAAGSAAAASLLGFLLYHSMPDYDQELAQRHLFGGLLFTCMALAAYLVKVWVDSAGGRGAVAYRFLLLVTAIVMGSASHDGASLTHGKGYLTDHAPDPLRRILGLPAREAPGSTAPAGNSDRVVYTEIIAPILDRKCYSCHNADKQKGKYRMDEYELLIKGGKEGDGIIPGNSAKSNVIVRIELPEDDDEHMPPEGKKDLDEHELLLLRWWIDQGASKDAGLSDLAVTDEVKTAISKQAQSATAEFKTPVDLSEPMKKEIERLRLEFPAALGYEFQNSGTLVFNALGMRGRFGDEQLARLRPVLSAVVSLDLSHTAVTDTGVRTLADATALKSLRLAETRVSDTALETLSSLRELESLNLHGTRVTGAGLLGLTSLPRLRKLYLWQTGVDEETLRTLREKLQDCEIITGS